MIIIILHNHLHITQQHKCTTKAHSHAYLCSCLFMCSLTPGTLMTSHHMASYHPLHHGNSYKLYQRGYCYIHIHIYVPISDHYIYICAHTYIHTYIHTYVYTYLCTNVCKYVYAY